MIRDAPGAAESGLAQSAPADAAVPPMRSVNFADDLPMIRRFQPLPVENGLPRTPE
jgi:hypothetical protein